MPFDNIKLTWIKVKVIRLGDVALPRTKKVRVNVFEKRGKYYASVLSSCQIAPPSVCSEKNMLNHNSIRSPSNFLKLTNIKYNTHSKWTSLQNRILIKTNKQTNKQTLSTGSVKSLKTYCVVLQTVSVQEFKFLPCCQVVEAIPEEIDFLLYEPAPQVLPLTQQSGTFKSRPNVKTQHLHTLFTYVWQ